MTDALPLSGIRVLSLAQQYPGPYATLLLSDLGADVVLVERPDGGDPSRRYPEFFAALNRGKRSVALDLKDPDGRAACRALALRSDVLLEGFRPGVAERLGLDHEELRTEHPSLVSVSISGFGQDGPYRDRPAHDLSFIALAGLLERPADGRAPAVPMLSLGDLAAGLFGAIAALTGLAARGANGTGAHYDVSMFDALVSLLTTLVVPPLNGAPAEGLGDDPGYGVYATADGEWLTLSIAFEDHFWSALCGTHDGLRPYATLAADERSARVDELRGVVARAIGSRPLAAWESVLADTGVPHAGVRPVTAIAEDPQAIARQLLTALPGGRRFVRQPLVVDGAMPGPTSDVPALGEHTDVVLGELGLVTAR